MFRRRIALAVVLIGLAACRKAQPPVAMSQPTSNVVAAYLHNAELQFESNAQGAEIQRALRDMLNLTPDELQKRRYADYGMVADSWDIITLLKKYFVAEKASLTLPTDLFYRDVAKKEARWEIQQQLTAVERALAK